MHTQKLLPLDIISKSLWAKIQSFAFDIALEKDLFIELAKSDKRTLPDIAMFLGMPVMSARILLQYLCAQQLLLCVNGAFKNAPVVEQLLIDEDYTAGLKSLSSYNFQNFKEKLYNPPPQPWYAIRTKKNSIDDNHGIDSSFFKLDHQHYWRIEKGMELSEQFNFDKYTHLLDIGGASGGWGFGIRQKFPHLEYTLYDLPEVCAIAQEIFLQCGTASSMNVSAGNIFDKPQFPESTDIILIANVLHDWNINDMKIILKNIFNSYSKITLLISELFVEDDWSGPVINIFQALLVLGQGNESGWQPTYSEMTEILKEIGFKIDKIDSNLIVCIK